MDSAQAAALFPLDQKFDFSALLKSAASTIASMNASTSLTGNITAAGNVVDNPATSTSTGGTIPPLPIPVSQLPPFSAMRPVYAPSGYGRQILIYDSRSYPGHRREFAYKTRFTNQSGLTTVYYRCMACRALRHRLQRILPKDKLPAVPCIAVKNDLLINDPDYPEASDHFCSPLTVQESNHRLKVTFERGYKRARMKMAAEEKNAAEQKAAAAASIISSITADNNTPTATCEITEQPLSIEQYFWMKNESSPQGSNGDDAAHSTSSGDDGHEVKPEPGLSSLLFDQRSTVTNTETTSTNSDVDMEDEQHPHQHPHQQSHHQNSKSRLDALIRLQDERENSTSPNENVFPIKSPLTLNPVLSASSTSSTTTPSSTFPPMSFFAPFMQNNPDLTSLMNLQSIVNNLTKNSSEIAKALKKPKNIPGAHKIVRN
uniref:Uncharacterized protein n=1 Tax=Panagrolaimus superbus TaxID=310955 RepID=A0A914ZBG3_9BILA